VSGLPHGWTTPSLREIASLITDGDHNPPKRTTEGIPHLTARNVRNGRFVLDGCTFISQENFRRTSARYTPTPGDVIVTCVGTLGETAIVPEGLSFSADRNLAAIRPRAVILSSFLKAMLDSPRLQKELRSGSGSTAQPHLYLGKLRELSIPLPPLSEQQQIVDAVEEQFSRLDSGVGTIERASRNIERMRAAIYEATVARSTDNKFIHTRLGDLLREPLRNGHSAKADPHGTVPIFTLTAVTYGDFGIHNIKMTAADPRRVRNLWIQPGDLLIERSNTRELVGTACLYRGSPHPAVFPDLVIRIRVDDRVMPEYVELILKSPGSRRYFQQRARGISGTMPKIDQQIIQDMPFTLPPLEMQAKIVQEAEQRLTLLGSAEKALNLARTRSKTLRSSILETAFSGHLRTEDSTYGTVSDLLKRVTTAQASFDDKKIPQDRKARASRDKATV
jgi:type I restriction enzyme, S subunit